MHGNKSQGQRERALAAFDSGKVDALVATDVAARGIDVDGISHVINFDPPGDCDAYQHRIGRTARAGRGGVGVTLVRHEEAQGRRQDRRHAQAPARVRRDRLQRLLTQQVVEPFVQPLRPRAQAPLSQRRQDPNARASGLTRSPCARIVGSCGGDRQ